MEIADGSVGVVSKLHAPGDGKAKIAVWRPYAAHQLGLINADNPYLVQNLSRLEALAARIVMDPLGHVVYREGGRS